MFVASCQHAIACVYKNVFFSVVDAKNTRILNLGLCYDTFFRLFFKCGTG